MGKYIRSLILIIILIGGGFCKQSKDHLVEQKNECYQAKLNELKFSPEYKMVISQFLDSFNNLKSREKILQFRPYEIDSAVFFSKDKEYCLLLVLQKSNDKLLFGYGRAIQGKKKNNAWSFELSHEFIYQPDFYEKYKTNDFKFLSELARFSVLTDGKINKNGCEIDEYYWFHYGE